MASFRQRLTYYDVLSNAIECRNRKRSIEDSATKTGSFWQAQVGGRNAKTVMGGNFRGREDTVLAK